MTRSRFRSFLAAAVIGAALAVSAVADVVMATYSCVTRAAAWLFDFTVFSLVPSAEPEKQTAPKVQLIRSKALKQRMDRREVIDLQPGYRMCPSI